jgi:hypothetical protein
MLLCAGNVDGDAEAVVPGAVSNPRLSAFSFMRPLLVLVVFSLSVCASEGEDAARRLLARLPKGPLSLTWQNLSTISADEADRIRQVVESGVDQQAAGAEALRVTLSENPRGYLVIAESTRMGVLIETWLKPAARIEKPAYHLVRTLLWEQPTPILDLAVDGERLYVLEPMRVAGKNVRATALALPRPMPRDPRGRIEVTPGGEQVKILLPGVRCAGPLSKLPCTIAREPWIVAARNYFEGTRGRFYTAADLGGVVFQAETDGRTRVYFLGSTGDALRVVEGWGSEIAALESTCGVHVLAALDTDQLQAFQYVGGNIKATTVPLVLDGPVTALWPSERKDQVTVIVNNRTTGNYEASRVAVSCTQ